MLVSLGNRVPQILQKSIPAIHKGLGTGFEQKFQAEVFSRFSPSKKITQGIFVNRNLKLLKSKGSPESFTKNNIFVKPFQTFQEVTFGC